MDTILKDLKDQFRKPGNGLIKIILINVLMYVALGIVFVITRWVHEQHIFNTVYEQFLLPAPIDQFLRKPWTLFTYFFAHSMHLGEVFHILFNMLFLYWFGRVVVEFIGSSKLISLYIMGGIIGGLVYILLFNTIPFFVERSQFPLVGSSGAVYAVVVAAATLVPNYTFFLFLIGPVRIAYIAAFCILISFLNAAGDDNAAGNICHLGGALFGYLYVTMLKRGTDLAAPVTWTSKFLSSLGKPRMKVTHRGKEKGSGKPTQAEIDAILDKISRSGYESLTKEEKKKLFIASQK